MTTHKQVRSTEEALMKACYALKELVEKFDSEQFTSICELDPAKDAIAAAEEALMSQSDGAQPSTVNQFHPDYIDEAINEMTLMIQKQAQRIEELEAKLAQPEQDAIGYVASRPSGKPFNPKRVVCHFFDVPPEPKTKLYATPQPKEPEQEPVAQRGVPVFEAICEAEAKLKEKNT